MNPVQLLQPPAPLAPRMSVDYSVHPRGRQHDEQVRLCRLCSSRISKYNDDVHCGPCTRRLATALLEPRVPGWLWAQPDVLEALATRDFGRLSVLLRQRISLRQEEMALLTGLSQAFLSMLETGARRLTNIDKIVTLLDRLEVPDELVSLVLRPVAPAPTRSRELDTNTPK